MRLATLILALWTVGTILAACRELPQLNFASNPPTPKVYTP